MKQFIFKQENVVEEVLYVTYVVQAETAEEALEMLEEDSFSYEEEINYGDSEYVRVGSYELVE